MYFKQGLLFFLFFTTNIQAAVTVKVITEAGEQKIVASKPIQATKNCESEIKEIVINRANWLYSGEYEKLSKLYVPSAVINHSTNLLNKKQKREAYLFSKFVEKLKKSRSEQDKYLFLQLSGHCQHKDGNLIYSGLEVEKLDFEGFEPMIASTIVKITFDTKTNKIKSEKQKVNIQLWNQNNIPELEVGK